MGCDGGVDILFLKHSIDHFVYLLGPFIEIFNSSQTGARANRNSRYEFEKSYKVPVGANVTIYDSGDDVDNRYTFSSLPIFLEELETMLETIAVYFPQDKQLLSTISWKDFVTNLEFFIPTWDPVGYHISYYLLESCLERTNEGWVEHKRVLDLLHKNIEINNYPVFFNTGLVDWIKLIKEEILNIEHHETWT